MIKNLLLFTLIFFSLNVFSQVTINRSHIIVPGRKVIEATDTNQRSIAVGGTSMIWEYTNLNTHIIDSLKFGVASWYKGYSNFPNANMAFVYYDNDSDITFLEITDTYLKLHGNYQITDTETIVNKFESRILSFPSTYNSSYTDASIVPGYTLPIGIDPDDAGPFPFIDSLGVSFQMNSKNTVDGWGTVKTPLGNYAALKQTNHRILSPIIKMYTSGAWVNVPSILLAMFSGQIPAADTSYSVNFWTNDASVGYPLVSYDYNEGDNYTDEVRWLMAKPNSSSISSVKLNTNFVYPNPVGESLTIVSTIANTHLQLFNMNGDLVLDQAVLDQTQINIQNLASGLYMLQLTDSSTGQIIGRHKLVKE